MAGYNRSYDLNSFSEGRGRTIPFAVRLRLLFGGPTGNFGWFFMGFGMIFFWVFGGNDLVTDTAFFSGELQSTSGKIVNSYETNLTINKRRVYEFKYNYKVDNQRYSGFEDGYLNDFKVGQKVDVEFPVNDVKRSRIKGFDQGKFQLGFVIIFPLVGLGFLIFNMIKGLRGIPVLKNGKLANGVLHSIKSTCMKVNKQPVDKYTFQFNTEDGRVYFVSAKTHDRTRFSGEDDVEQIGGVVEPLVYLEENPDKAFLLDDLPGFPRLDGAGRVKKMSLIPVLILPTIVLGGHGFWVLKLLEVIK